MVGRASIGWIIAVAAVAGCVDSGLPGKNLPREEARTRAFRYAVYDATLNVPAVKLEDREWVVAGPANHIPESMLTRVGVDGEREVFALSADVAPFDRIYVRSNGGFVPLAPAP